MKRLFMLQFGIVLLAFCSAQARAAEPSANEGVPPPAAFEAKNVSIAVLIPEPLKFIEKLEALGNAFAPKQVRPGMLKAQLGMMFNDPNLAELVAGKPIVIVFFTAEATHQDLNQPKPPEVAFLIPTKAAAPYDAVLKQLELDAAFANGVLIAAKSPDTVKKAQAQADLYESLTKTPVKADARVSIKIQALMNSYAAQLERAVKEFGVQAGAMTMPGNPQGLADILALEVKLLNSVMSQVDISQIDINLKADEIATSNIISAKAATPLFNALQAPGRAGENPTLKVLTKGDLLAGSFRFNTEGYAAFQKKIFDDLKADPKGQQYITAEVADAFQGMSEDLTGDMAFGMASSEIPAPGNDQVKIPGPPENNFVIGIKQGDKYLKAVETMTKLMGADGALGKLYAGLGMKISSSFVRDARKHGTVAVHRMKMSVEVDGAMAMQAEQIKNSIRDQEFALVNSLALVSTNPATLNAMIEKAQQGAAAKQEVLPGAVKAFGEGRQIYIDYDLLGVVKAGVASNPMLGMMLGNFKSGDPMLLSMSTSNGRGQMDMKLSLKPYIAIAQMFMGMMGGGGPDDEKEAPPVLVPPDGGGKGDKKPKDEKF